MAGRKKRSEVAGAKVRQSPLKAAERRAEKAPVTRQATGPRTLRHRCPACGMVGNVYRNPFAPASPSLEEYPHGGTALWWQTFGGGMEYSVIQTPEAILGLLKLEAANLAMALLDVLKELNNAGIDLPTDPAMLLMALGTFPNLWADFNRAVE